MIHSFGSFAWIGLGFGAPSMSARKVLYVRRGALLFCIGIKIDRSYFVLIRLKEGVVIHHLF
jgi:hypothetical protein